MPVLESLFNKVAGLQLTFLKRDSNIGVFLVCEIFENIYFEEHLPATASVFSQGS